ncbi:two-component response regulator 24-like [Cajanus cajan]|uniref:two-component response regulator 24-like n=1 Tax=Cajanus cajan TaxID=3821 RepID=UPI00098DB320|nr:two-component response regulator 24-like [Cajanus cajan]
MEEGQGSNKHKVIIAPILEAETEREKLGNEFSAIVVEEDVVVRMGHKEILTLNGAKTCDTVGNGREATTLHLNGKRFDIILMDLDMPDDDGFNTIDTLRSLGVRSLILSVSGPCCPEIFPRLFKEVPIDGHLIKPLTVQMLGEALQKFKS